MPYPPIIVPALRPILSDFKTKMMSIYGNRLNKIYLFGSYARGEATQHSDIDLLVILYDESIDVFQELTAISDVAFSLSLEYEELIGAVVTTNAQFTSLSEPLFQEILKDGIVL